MLRCAVDLECNVAAQAGSQDRIGTGSGVRVSRGSHCHAIPWRILIELQQLIGDVAHGRFRADENMGARFCCELAFERSGPERFMQNFYILRELVRVLGARPDVRGAEGLGRLVAQLHALRRMSVSVAGMLEAGQEPTLEGSIVKDLGTTWQQTLAPRARDLTALLEHSEIDDGADRAVFDALLDYATLAGPKLTIQGGTTEILRGIIARGLGLR